MKLKSPINENYAGVFTTISTTVKLDNCDNVHHAIIFGNAVIVGKDVQVGSKGIFFPAETRLSEEYLHHNNLYRDNTLNKDINEKGYFELNGRIRCMRFRGHKSEGLFMPLSSLLFAAQVGEVAKMSERDTFDEINGIKICEKYVPKQNNTPSSGGGKKGKVHAKKVSKLVENQFRFHSDTAMLGRNMHRIVPSTIMQLTNKLHGTSFVVANILCKKKLNWWERLIKKVYGGHTETEYDIIYSSRKVIKNDDLNKNYNHYYKEDVWKNAAELLRDVIPKGVTLYGECVGFTKGGRPIQEGYDYGYSAEFNTSDTKPYGVYIYRITYTNTDGKVFEMSAGQVQEWCKLNGVQAVPEFFYGKAKELVDSLNFGTLDAWRDALLTMLLTAYNMEEDCKLCKNKVPAEGMVLRIDDGLDYEAYKLKSFRFRERETKLLDAGEVDIETEQS
jgi:hypothetical protein